jgi:hypothetical protein
MNALPNSESEQGRLVVKFSAYSVYSVYSAPKNNLENKSQSDDQQTLIDSLSFEFFLG